MPIFELVLCLLLGGVGLALAAPRIAVPWPVLLALAGTCLAFVPGVPPVALDPRLALALFVAPALLDAAYDASPRDLRDNWVPVSLMVLVAVGLTAAGVFLVARALVPSMPWQAALALGAIVAPPDAAAAAAVLRELRMPHRVQTILEGESLLNDASALLIYRFAISAAAGAVTLWSAPLLALSILGGVALGVALAWLFFAVMVRVEDGPASVLLQFLSTFGVWLLADALGVSAVLAMVAYAMVVARLAPSRTTARQRRASYAVWDLAVFVLNILAFILVGLQLRGILGRVDGRAAQYLAFALAVLGTVIAVRFAWVMGYNTAVRWKNRHFGVSTARPMLLPTVAGGLTIAWCGMRGMVTLAAALALPDRFPERDLIVFAAFGVVLGTLVLQGLSLRPLLARLDLPQDDRVADETALARAEAASAALDALGGDRDTPAGHLLREEYEARQNEGSSGRLDKTGLSSLRRRMLDAERSRLSALRHEGRIGDGAFHRLEEELDWAEAELDDVAEH